MVLVDETGDPRRLDLRPDPYPPRALTLISALPRRPASLAAMISLAGSMNEACAPTCSISICRRSASRCGRRRRAMPRGCWWCGPARRRKLEDRVVRDLARPAAARRRAVVNDTRVIPARLPGRRLGRGAEPPIEATLHQRLDGSRWRAFVKPAKRLDVGRRRALRRRGQGLFPRPARRHGRGQGRGRRGDARVCVPRPGARPGDRRARRHAAAALHRRAPRARRARPRRLPDHVRATTKARSRRRPPGCISPTALVDAADGARHRRCTR